MINKEKKIIFFLIVLSFLFSSILFARQVIYLEKGITINRISKACKIPEKAILNFNNISDPRKIKEGSKLVIPTNNKCNFDKIKSGQSEKVNNREITASQQRAKKYGLGTIKSAMKLFLGKVDEQWIKLAGGRQFPKTLRFPVPKGWIMRGFGSGEGGNHFALDIGSDKPKIVAAERGIVGYSGNQLKGYGNIILIIHPGGLITLYAHNKENLVEAGQKVKKGQLIGLIGSTGISKGPHLHFELIYDGYVCDPIKITRPLPKKGIHINPKQIKLKSKTPITEQLVCKIRQSHHKQIKETLAEDNPIADDIEIDNNENAEESSEENVEEKNQNEQ